MDFEINGHLIQFRGAEVGSFEKGSLHIDRAALIRLLLAHVNLSLGLPAKGRTMDEVLQSYHAAIDDKGSRQLSEEAKKIHNLEQMNAALTEQLLEANTTANTLLREQYDRDIQKSGESA